MSLFSKFSKGSSGNSRQQSSQTPNGFQSTSRGPKPPTTGPSYTTSAQYGGARNTSSSQGSDPILSTPPRKSSRSPSSFFRRMSPQYQQNNHNSTSAPATQGSSQPVHIYHTNSNTTSSTSTTKVPVLETRSSDTQRAHPSESQSTNSWRNFFSRSSSRDKEKAPPTTGPPMAAATAVRPPSASSQVPSNGSWSGAANSARQRGAVNRVFEGMSETQSTARPAYGNSPSKTSLNNGTGTSTSMSTSVPISHSESPPKSTMRSQQRTESVSHPVQLPTMTRKDSPSVAAPTNGRQPEPAPASNSRQSVAPTTNPQRRDYVAQTRSPSPPKAPVRATAQSSPYYVAAQPQRIPPQTAASASALQIVSAPKNLPESTHRTANGSGAAASTYAQHGASQTQTLQIMPAPRTSTDSTARARNANPADNALALAGWSSMTDANAPASSSRPPNRAFASAPPNALPLAQQARHRFDSWRAPMQVVTTRTYSDDNDTDFDDLLTPSSLDSGTMSDLATPVQAPPAPAPAPAKPAPKLLAANAQELPSREDAMALVRRESETSVVVAPKKPRSDSMVSSTSTSSSASSEVFVALPLTLMPPPKEGYVPSESPASSAFPPLITFDDQEVAPRSAPLELTESTHRHLQRSGSDSKPDARSRRDEDAFALAHRTQTTTRNAIPALEYPDSRGAGTSNVLAIAPAPADSEPSSQLVVRPTGTVVPREGQQRPVEPENSQAVVRRSSDSKRESSGGQLPGTLVVASRSLERVNESRVVASSHKALPLPPTAEQSLEPVRHQKTVGHRPSLRFEDRSHSAPARDTVDQRVLVPYTVSAERIGESRAITVGSAAPGRMDHSSEVALTSRAVTRRTSSREIVPTTRVPEHALEPRPGPRAVARRPSRDVGPAVIGKINAYSAISNSVASSSTTQLTNVEESVALTKPKSRAATLEMAGDIHTHAIVRRPSRDVLPARHLREGSQNTSITLVPAVPEQELPANGPRPIASTDATALVPSDSKSSKDAPLKLTATERRPREIQNPQVTPNQSDALVPSAPPEKRTLAQRAPRRLSIVAPPPAVVNAILSPVSSESSATAAPSIDLGTPDPPPPKVIEPAPAPVKLESSLVPMPATPSVLPAPPPSPQSERGLALPRRGNSRPPPRGEPHKPRALPSTVEVTVENARGTELLRPPRQAALRGLTPSPLSQAALPGPEIADLIDFSDAPAFVVPAPAAEQKSTAALQVQAAPSVPPRQDAQSSVESLAIVPSSTRTNEVRRSERKSRQASHPPVTSNDRDGQSSHMHRRRIESTPAPAGEPSTSSSTSLVKPPSGALGADLAAQPPSNHNTADTKHLLDLVAKHHDVPTSHTFHRRQIEPVSTTTRLEPPSMLSTTSLAKESRDHSRPDQTVDLRMLMEPNMKPISPPSEEDRDVRSSRMRRRQTEPVPDKPIPDGLVKQAEVPLISFSSSPEKEPPVNVAARPSAEPRIPTSVSSSKVSPPTGQMTMPTSSSRPPTTASTSRPADQLPVRSSSDQSLSVPRKTRTPSPTNEPVTVRRHPVPVLIPPPPDPRPSQDTEMPPRRSEDSTFSTKSQPISISSGISNTRPKQMRASTLPTPNATPMSSIESVSTPTPLKMPTPPPAPAAPTARVWRSTRSRAPSALNAISPSNTGANPTPIPRATHTYTAARPPTTTPAAPTLRSTSRTRELSLPSNLSPTLSPPPTFSFYPGYATLTEREARLEKAQREFERETDNDYVSPSDTIRSPPKPFTAVAIPPSKKNSPFAFLSRNRHTRTLSSASIDAAGGSVTMGSVAASRRSGFSDFTPPPSPPPVENVVHQWNDTFTSIKPRKPGVTWDLESSSPVASFQKLMKLDQFADRENA